MARFKEDESAFQSWGHSTLVDPMGKVLASCNEEPGIVYGDIDPENVDELRKSLPCQFQKRTDLYTVELKK